MQQLELFPQPTPMPQYKAGDWVKIKRKPAIAAWIKRGEIFKVNAVHPIDGSVQIWNPHINQWDFLYPDEIKPCPTPTNVETVVEHLELASTVETVVEHLELASTVETVVEHLELASTVETVVEHLELNKEDNGYSPNGWIDFHYKIRTDGKQRSMRHQENKYNGPYYTYRWREGKKQRGKYVPAKKVGEVYRAIGTGQPTSEILKIISSPNKLDTILKK
jgi:hypothetical protein